MNTKIEENLVLGLVRIFTEYGWKGKGAPESWDAKLATIAYGLHHGQAFDYKTHLSLLISARQKDHDWGLYTSEYVQGILTLLTAYADNNDLFNIKYESVPPITYKEKSDNIFTGSPALKRLEKNGNTVISYTLLEKYGFFRIVKDLNEHYPRGMVSVKFDEHKPDQIRDWLYDDGNRRMTVYYPIMPIIIITTGEDE